jgi:hypothetical protein
MKRLDKLIFGIMIGSAFPIFLFMIALAIWFYFFQNANVLYFVFVGLSTGLLFDLIFLKRLVENKYNLPSWMIIGIYALYNICIFGFFMGFPVFNLSMGMIAGYYFGKRLRYNNISFVESKLIIIRVSIFTSLIMLFICIASAFIANIGEGVGKDLQHMFRLNFEVTRTMIWGIILIGGMSLIISQFFLTKFTMIKTIKYKNINDF